jgi:serine/threonine-protein kinase HipA
VDTRDHYWRGGLLPFFEHLGPEGWLRGRQARAGGTANQDDFGLLLNYGADCIGAVGILPAEQDTPVHPIEEDAIDEAATTAGRTLSGVQKKLLAYQADGEYLPSVEASDPATHIAKFNREDLPTVVQNEHLSLSLAREVLGENEVTKANLGTLRGIDGIVLLVERFDRNGDERLRLEDFAQILNRPRGRTFDGKYEGSYEEAAEVVSRHSARGRIDLDRLYRLIVFNLVLGNADAHLKNFSLLERPEGLRLSPAYDLINTLAYPIYDQLTALSIGGKKRQFDTLDRSIVERLGLDFGLPAAAVTKALADLGQRFSDARVLELSDKVQPDDFRFRYRDIIQNHAQRILR